MEENKFLKDAETYFRKAAFCLTLILVSYIVGEIFPDSIQNKPAMFAFIAIILGGMIGGLYHGIRNFGYALISLTRYIKGDAA